MIDRETASAKLEVIIGRVLRTGVAVATVFLAAGLALGAVSPAAAGWCLRAGLLILMGTPAARVIASIVEFASARDWTFVVLSAIVLLELGVGAIAAAVFHTRL